MADKNLQRMNTDGVVTPMADPMAGDPVARLEPLAVPVGRIFSILRRHLWVVVLCPVLMVGGAVVMLKRLPKQFTAAAAIVVEPQRTQVSDLQAISPDLGDSAGVIRTQIDILRSQALNLRVVRELNLARVPEFVPAGGGAMFMAKQLLERLGVLPPAPIPVLTEDQRAEVAAGMLSGKVSFLNEARSAVLQITVTTQDPGLSATIANEIVEVFLDFKRQEKFKAMQRAHDWLQEQLGTLAEQLRADDRAVEQYRQQHKLDDQPLDDAGVSARAGSINRQQLDVISAQLVDVARERARKEGELAQAQAVIRGQLPGSQLPAVLASPVIGALLAQTATVAAHEAQLASSQGPANPELVAARAQLRGLQQRTQQEMTNVANSLATEVQAARAQEQSLRSHQERLRGAVSDENTAQIALRELQVKARATRSIYDSFLLRATQLANVAGIQQPDAALVSGARPPLGPSGPKVVQLLAVAGFLSLALGAGLACAMERLRGGFSLPEELEAALGLPLIGVLPKVPRRRLRGQRQGKAGIALSSSLDNLRGQIRLLGDARPKVVMITSSLPQEGKSMLAASLARNAASAGWRVILVECDFFNPTQAAHFGVKAGAGLASVLEGNLLGDSGRLIHEVQQNLHVMPGGRTKRDPQELFASPRMEALLAELRNRYDLVVLDTPAVLPVPDALVLAQRVDATMMVVRWEKTPRPAVQDAVRRLRESRGRILGVAMTQVNLRVAAGAVGRMPYAFTQYGTYHVVRDQRA